MGRVGDTLSDPRFEEQFVDHFEDALEVTNYVREPVETAPDEFDSPEEKQPSSDSPIATTGQIQLIDTRSDGEAWGRDTEADVEILLPESVPVSDGDVEGYPYASEVRHVPTGRVYRVGAIHNEGNGRVRCAASTGPQR